MKRAANKFQPHSGMENVFFMQAWRCLFLFLSTG